MDDYLEYDDGQCMDDSPDYCEGCFADCPMQNPKKNCNAYLDCVER